jgi:hypothetical protein
VKDPRKAATVMHETWIPNSRPQQVGGSSEDLRWADARGTRQPRRRHNSLDTWIHMGQRLHDVKEKRDV